MEVQQVIHQSINGKYEIQLEKAASTKGQDGFKVVVKGDDYDQVKQEAEALYEYAKNLTKLVGRQLTEVSK